MVDSNRDSTPQIAEQLRARVIRQVPPQGYVRAMARVLKECRGDVVVTLDCDGTYPADEIPRLAGMVLGGECDVVNASRLERRPAAMPWPNYFANWLFAFTGRILVGVKSTDLHSGMRAYSRQVIERVEVDSHGPALPVHAVDLPPYLPAGIYAVVKMIRRSSVADALSAAIQPPLSVADTANSDFKSTMARKAPIITVGSLAGGKPRDCP